MPRAPRKVEISLEYQNYIENPPITTNQMMGAATSNDQVTVDTWRKIWVDNVKANKKRFGSFKEHSIGKFFEANKYKPVIVAGSGPSLAYNGENLKDRGDIPLVSCLHNYQFFEDRGVKVDYYVTLDAGPVVIEEVYEGGSKSPEEYWESTKDKVLLAYIGTDPRLFDKWKGQVYFYNSPIPEASIIKDMDEVEKFNIFLSSGGNVLGAAFCFAKAILGSGAIAFVGADFCFSYDKKFHAWKSKYDEKLGYVLKSVDVYGNKVLTWQSYANFKHWFDFIALTVPGIYVNCTEGGTFGAYADGNIMAVRQQPLLEFLDMYKMHEQMGPSCKNSEIDEKRVFF